jgi:uncharacterized Rmd1/YagE family protein
LTLTLCFLTPHGRIKILDEKVTHVKSVINTLIDDLKHQHSIRLERIIIFLIMIEVMFGTIDHFSGFVFFARGDAAAAAGNMW